MQLSLRMAAVAEMAAEAVRLADIGADHGYVPIYLALQGHLKHAIAMDVHPGPLARAQEHIRQYHLEEVIETRLSDGAKKLLPGEADTVVIAGMGGRLTMEILTEGAAQLEGVRTFVLQPQSEIADVRRFLHQNGFCIADENMVKEDGKFYQMMKVCRGQQEKWEAWEYRYGKYLIARKNPALAEFLKHQERAAAEILAQLRQQEGARADRRRGELRRELLLIQKARRTLT